MKFTAKLIGLLNGVQPIIGVSETGTKREYPDAFKVSITAKPDDLVVATHNGNVAASASLKDQPNIDYVHAADGTITVNSKDLTATLLSFEKDEIVDVELKGTELTFTPHSDPEKLQTVPSEVRAIEMPTIATAASKEAKVNKGALIEAMNRTLFAIGFEKFRPEFLYWELKIEPKLIRVWCGDGGRFPVYQIEGDNIVDGKGTTYLFYKEQNPSLQKVLAGVDAEHVTLKEYKRENDSDPITDQFIVIVGNITLVLIGHDPGVKYPDPGTFLNRKSNYKFVTKAADWEKEFAGAWATYNEDVRSQNQVHKVYMTFDTKKGIITLKAENTMRSLRKVKISDFWIESGHPDTVEFCVTSPILKDVIKQASGGNIQMELVDGKAPMLVRYFVGDKVADAPIPKVNSAAGTSEQYSIFFGAYNKK